MLQGLRQRQYIATQAHPGWAGYPTFKRLHCKTPPRLSGLPGLVDRAARLGGLPHLSRKCEAEKINVYMDKRVIPPPCKDNGNVKEHVSPRYNSAISQVFCDYSVLLTNTCTVRATNYPVVPCYMLTLSSKPKIW